MRALRLHAAGDLRLDDVPPPRTAPGIALVAVEACGVCGSDLHFIDGTARTAHLPLTLGHEVAGTVADPGDTGLEQGAPVVVELGSPCGECARCREGAVNLCSRNSVLGIDVDGGLADLVAAPASSIHPRPRGLDAAIAAPAMDAGITARHAVMRRGAVAEGDSVLIIGVGGLGSFGVQFARIAGASAVIAADSDPAALQLAVELGADDTVLVEEGTSVGRAVKMLTDGGVDIAIEFVGRAATVDAAVKSIRPGGRAVAVGVGIEPLTTLPPVLWSNNEYTLTGAYGGRPGDAQDVVARLADGSLRPPPVTTIDIDDAVPEILARAKGERRPPGRLVVTT
jgi:propanol-preferring alcohol dehydrogenase